MHRVTRVTQSLSHSLRESVTALPFPLPLPLPHPLTLLSDSLAHHQGRGEGGGGRPKRVARSSIAGSRIRSLESIHPAIHHHSPRTESETHPPTQPLRPRYPHPISALPRPPGPPTPLDLNSAARGPAGNRAAGGGHWGDNDDEDHRPRSRPVS